MRLIVEWAAALALASSALACDQPDADGAPVFPEESPRGADSPTTDLAVWPADEELRRLVLAVAPRIERATGLVVTATTDTNAGPPMFWSQAIGDDSWLGFTHVDSQRNPEWLAIEPDTPSELRESIVLHELLHALGADHVLTGEGVLSPELWIGRDWTITEADLTVLCGARDCPIFEPEGEQ